MKKTMFTKAFAVLASVAVLGVSSVIGAGAASNNGTVAISSTTAKPGDTVSIDVSVKDNPGLTAFGAVITFDPALTFVEGEATTLLTMVDIATDENRIAIGGAATSTVSRDGVIATLTFIVPEDATEEDSYEISWSVDEDKKIRQFQDGSTVYTPAIENGVITIEDDVPGTTPAETEEETTPVTEAEPPKTGASTKGIAATSAVLLAAACSAVVLKKKRD
jgi:hypothetical protein